MRHRVLGEVISKRTRKSSVLAATMTLLFSLSMTAGARADQVRALDIPAQDLGAALKAFGAAADEQVLFTQDAVAGRRSAAVQGDYTTAAALATLLKGSGLQVDRSAAGVLLVRPAAPSSVRQIAPRASKDSAVDLRSDTSDVAIADRGLIRLAQATPRVQAQASSTAGASDARGPIVEEIIVVGSSLKTSKDAVEGGALPIQLIAAEELAASGARTIGEFLRSEPAFSGGSTGLGTGSTRTTLNLRGLGEQYTLTLVNGRRTGVNGPANVARIPIDAIERIEVLKAGASAVYGADAVTGVVNIVLKNRGEGAGVSARYGSADAYDDQELAAHFGANGDSGSFFALVNFRDSTGLRAIERRVTESNDKRPLGGRDVRSGLTLPAPIVLPDGRVMIINTDTVPVGSTSTNPADFRLFNFERDAHDRQPFGVYALAPNKNVSLLFSAETSLSDTTKLSGDVLFDRTEVPNIGGSSTMEIAVPASNPYNPFGVPVVARYRGLDLGVGYKSYAEMDSISGGVQLEHQLTSALTLSVGANYSMESLLSGAFNSYSRRGAAEAISRLGADALNPFGNRANSPEQLRGFMVQVDNKYDERLHEFDARLSGAVFELPTGDVQMAVGASSRNEWVHERPDALIRINDIADVSARQEFELDRDVSALFGELRIPLLRATGGESPLELGVAVRYEDYSDFGDTLDPLVSLRWQATPTWGLRASYNTSFRAPYLDNLIPNSNQTDITVIDPLTGQREEAVAITGGNPNLKTEDATTLAAGVVFTPQALPGLFMSLDYYDIEQENVIIAPTPQAVLNGDIPGQVIRGENVGRGGEDLMIIAQLTNVAKRNVSGLDWLSRYSLDFAGGSQLSFNLAAHYLLTFEADQLDGRGFVSSAGKYSTLFTSLPRIKASGGVSWRLEPFTANLIVSHVSDYTDPPIEGVARAARTTDAVTTIDLSASYDLAAQWSGIRKTSITLGVDNVLDDLPPFILARNDFDRGQHDILGRYVYGAINFSF